MNLLLDFRTRHFAGCMDSFMVASSKNTIVAEWSTELALMITIIAKCTAKKDSVDDLLELALELVKSSRKEDGNVSYDFYQDITFPEKFTFIECWKDSPAIEAHNATTHFNHFVEKTGKIFAGPLDVALFRKLT